MKNAKTDDRYSKYNSAEGYQFLQKPCERVSVFFGITACDNQCAAGKRQFFQCILPVFQMHIIRTGQEFIRDIVKTEYQQQQHSKQERNLPGFSFKKNACPGESKHDPKNTG